MRRRSDFKKWQGELLSNICSVIQRIGTSPLESLLLNYYFFPRKSLPGKELSALKSPPYEITGSHFNLPHDTDILGEIDLDNEVLSTLQVKSDRDPFVSAHMADPVQYTGLQNASHDFTNTKEPYLTFAQIGCNEKPSWIQNV